MRKLENEMLNALRAGRAWHSGNTSVTAPDNTRGASAPSIHDYLPRHREPPATRLFQLESIIIRLLTHINLTLLPPDLLGHIFTVSPRVRDALTKSPPQTLKSPENP